MGTTRVRMEPMEVGNSSIRTIVAPPLDSPTGRTALTAPRLSLDSDMSTWKRCGSLDYWFSSNLTSRGSADTIRFDTTSSERTTVESWGDY